MENEASCDHLTMYLFQSIECLAFLQEVEDWTVECWTYCSHHVEVDLATPRSSSCIPYPFSIQYVVYKTGLLLQRFVLWNGIWKVVEKNISSYKHIAPTRSCYQIESMPQITNSYVNLGR